MGSQSDSGDLEHGKSGTRTATSRSGPTLLAKLLEAIPATLIACGTLLVIILRLCLGCIGGRDRRVAAIGAAKRGVGNLVGGGSIFRKALRILWFLTFITLLSSILGFRVVPTHSVQSLKGYGSAAIFTFKHDGPGFMIGNSDSSAASTENDGAATPDEEDEVPATPPPVTKKKWRRKEEVALACVELDCQESCQRKATKKCKKSEGCMKERAKACRKKCRKSRCETRCADEPTLGYVEKEMKLENCKEGCQNDKCKTKCDHEFEGCKVKCKANAHRYVCDRPVDTSQSVEFTVSNVEDESAGEDDESAGFLPGDEDNDDPPI